MMLRHIGAFGPGDQDSPWISWWDWANWRFARVVHRNWSDTTATVTYHVGPYKRARSMDWLEALRDENMPKEPRHDR